MPLLSTPGVTYGKEGEPLVHRGGSIPPCAAASTVADSRLITLSDGVACRSRQRNGILPIGQPE